MVSVIVFLFKHIYLERWGREKRGDKEQEEEVCWEEEGSEEKVEREKKSREEMRRRRKRRDRIGSVWTLRPTRWALTHTQPACLWVPCLQCLTSQRLAMLTMKETRALLYLLGCYTALNEWMFRAVCGNTPILAHHSKVWLSTKHSFYFFQELYR